MDARKNGNLDPTQFGTHGQAALPPGCIVIPAPQIPPIRVAMAAQRSRLNHLLFIAPRGCGRSNLC